VGSIGPKIKKERKKERKRKENKNQREKGKKENQKQEKRERKKERAPGGWTALNVDDGDLGWSGHENSRMRRVEGLMGPGL